MSGIQGSVVGFVCPSVSYLGLGWVAGRGTVRTDQELLSSPGWCNIGGAWWTGWGCTRFSLCFSFSCGSRRPSFQRPHGGAYLSSAPLIHGRTTIPLV